MNITVASNDKFKIFLLSAQKRQISMLGRPKLCVGKETCDDEFASSVAQFYQACLLNTMQAVLESQT